MNRPFRLIALGLGFVLLSAPAAWACGELGMMSVGCPMGGAEMAEMAEMADEMSTCHTGDAAQDDCCNIESAPEPVQAAAFGSAKLLTSLEAADPQPVASRDAAAHRARVVSVAPHCPHDLGRFTLHASYLL